MKSILKYQVILSETYEKHVVFRHTMRGQPKSDIDLYVIGKVKELRTEHKMSQAVLATKLEVSDAFIGQVETPKNRCKYSVEQLNKLAEIFECSPRDFFPEKPINSK